MRFLDELSLQNKWKRYTSAANKTKYTYIQDFFNVYIYMSKSMVCPYLDM